MYLYLFDNSPIGQTRRRLFTLSGSNYAVCAFWGFFDIAPYFKGEIPTNRNFWRVNKRFQAKRGKIWKVSYYRNYWIDSYQILHSDRDHKVVIAANKPKMTNGRHFEKNR